MNQLFRAVSISKQSFHQYHDRLMVKLQEEAYLDLMVQDIRRDHPTMGCRDMYFKIAPSTMGRDAFEDFCHHRGYMLSRKPNYRITTDSMGVRRFDNLTLNLSLTAADQLWVSDITYFELSGRFYYLTFVLDAFTKRILGHSVSKRLYTERTTLAALRMAIKTRNKATLQGMIFHSDGGGQYYDKTFLKLTGSYSIKNSMCKYAWENPYAERINGVIKNNYLKHRSIKSFDGLYTEVDRAVKLYNYEKPHKSLGRQTPIEFERFIFETQKQSNVGNLSNKKDVEPCQKTVNAI